MIVESEILTFVAYDIFIVVFYVSDFLFLFLFLFTSEHLISAAVADVSVTIVSDEILMEVADTDGENA